MTSTEMEDHNLYYLGIVASVPLGPRLVQLLHIITSVMNVNTFLQEVTKPSYEKSAVLKSTFHPKNRRRKYIYIYVYILEEEAVCVRACVCVEGELQLQLQLFIFFINMK